jgi:hypothetical protein
MQAFGILNFGRAEELKELKELRMPILRATSS